MVRGRHEHSYLTAVPSPGPPEGRSAVRQCGQSALGRHRGPRPVRGVDGGPLQVGHQHPPRPARRRSCAGARTWLVRGTAATCPRLRQDPPIRATSWLEPPFAHPSTIRAAAPMPATIPAAVSTVEASRVPRRSTPPRPSIVGGTHPGCPRRVALVGNRWSTPVSLADIGFYLSACAGSQASAPVTYCGSFAATGRRAGSTPCPRATQAVLTWPPEPT